jgi:hypothetical protein
VKMFILLALMLLSRSFVQATAQCFQPLKTPFSTDVTEWKDLAEMAPTVTADGVISVQTIKSGVGDKINLDFYSVTFQKDKNHSLEEFFKRLRLRFPELTHGQESMYGYTASNWLFPYRGTSVGDDKLLKQNETRWQSDDPKGAVMSFALATTNYRPALTLVATTGGKTISVVQKHGDVAVTCSSSTDFVFSTLETTNGGKHPVSGNRGFGLKDNKDGTWTFYTKGADRQSDSKLNSVKTIPSGADAIFLSGNDFWLQFFANLKEFLNDNGTPVVPGSFKTNSKRYDYPL